MDWYHTSEGTLAVPSSHDRAAGKMHSRRLLPQNNSLHTAWRHNSDVATNLQASTRWAEWQVETLAAVTDGAEGDTRACRQGLEICRHIYTQQAVQQRGQEEEATGRAWGVLLLLEGVQAGEPIAHEVLLLLC